MATLILGTAGHVDHGKSALVLTLTGTDPDRLKEEKRRGITIELGFADARIGAVDVSFVDVPGHERFVRHMIAGATAIDAVLLVVAADEAVKPQTREHFDICRLLGFARGVIALTKVDLVDEAQCAVAAADVGRLVAGSFLERAEIVPVSVRTGVGLEVLRRAIVALASTSGRPVAGGSGRLSVDRSFVVKGFGTVVTGTLVRGRVAAGDDLEVVPGGRRVHVRGLQVHRAPVADVSAPRRLALNLSKADVRDVPRGVTLAGPGTISATRRLDAVVETVANTPALTHGARCRVHLGTADVPARVSIDAVRARPEEAWTRTPSGRAGAAIPPGGAGLVRLRLDRSVAAARHDRIILRTSSPSSTVAGGRVLDPEPPGRVSRSLEARVRFIDAVPADVFALWLAEAGARGVSAADFTRRCGLDADATNRIIDQAVTAGHAVVAGDRAFAATLLARTESAALEHLGAFHRQSPDATGYPRATLRDRVGLRMTAPLFDAAIDRLIGRGLVEGRDRLMLVSERARVPDDQPARLVIERAFETAGLGPPDAGALAAATAIPVAVLASAINALVRDRRLVRVGDVVFHPEALGRLKRDVQTLRGGAIDVAAFKARYGLTRKFAIPLLEWLDRERVTRRTGETRIVI